ncbi:hypothetical protein HOY82DRAFT_647068 [Tuber indicum]|nr:hypothetical protein HOY82DRAFT_647068 [Tuber indicum]
MSVPTKGLGVRVIEGSEKKGRIFFGGREDNDIYGVTYQAEEQWFYGRCGKICQTSDGVSSFAPRIPLQFSAIRAFHVKGETAFSLSTTHSFSQTLANIRVIIGNTPLLEPKAPIVSISPMTSQQARRAQLIATTTTGCRLYMSPVVSEYGFGGSGSAPTSTQVIHIRCPPPTGPTLTPAWKATVFAPGYCFYFAHKPNDVDELSLSTPDPGQ